jgi:hypothetical protein
VLAALEAVDEDRRRTMGDAARRRVLAEHTAAHRVERLETLVGERYSIKPV